MGQWRLGDYGFQPSSRCQFALDETHMGIAFGRFGGIKRSATKPSMTAALSL